VNALECFQNATCTKKKLQGIRTLFCSNKVLRIPKKLRGDLLRGFSIEDKPPYIMLVGVATYHQKIYALADKAVPASPKQKNQNTKTLVKY
jgi:hypothetical protein